MFVKCFITIFIHKQDGAEGLKQKQKTVTEVLSKQGYTTEKIKAAKGGRRVTIYTTIKSEEGETPQQAIDKICQTISQTIERKVVGRPLKA